MVYVPRTAVSTVPEATMRLVRSTPSFAAVALRSVYVVPCTTVIVLDPLSAIVGRAERVKSARVTSPTPFQTMSIHGAWRLMRPYPVGMTIHTLYVPGAVWKRYAPRASEVVVPRTVSVVMSRSSRETPSTPGFELVAVVPSRTTPETIGCATTSTVRVAVAVSPVVGSVTEYVISYDPRVKWSTVPVAIRREDKSFPSFSAVAPSSVYETPCTRVIRFAPFNVMTGSVESVKSPITTGLTPSHTISIHGL